MPLEDNHGPYYLDPLTRITGFHFDRLCESLGSAWVTLYEAQFGGSNPDIAIRMDGTLGSIHNVIVNNGKVYLLGNSLYDEIYIYDIATDILTTQALTIPSQSKNIAGNKFYQNGFDVFSMVSRPDLYDVFDKYTTLNYINKYDLDPDSLTVYQNLFVESLPEGYRGGSLIETADKDLYYLFYDPSEDRTDPATLSDKIWINPGGSGTWTFTDSIPSGIMTSLNNWLSAHGGLYGSFTNASYSKNTNSIYLLLNNIDWTVCAPTFSQYCVEYNLDTGIWTEFSGMPVGVTDAGPYQMSNGLLYYLCQGAFFYTSEIKCAEYPYLIEFNPEDKSFNQIAGYPRQAEEAHQSLALNCPFVFGCDGNESPPIPEVTFALHYYNW